MSDEPGERQSLHQNEFRLEHDVGRIHQLMSRRNLLKTALAGGATALLAGCGSGAADEIGQGSANCRVIPQEMVGPYPGDGSNRAGKSIANVLVESGIVRSDIRSSFGGSTMSAAGVPLTLTMRLVNSSSRCTPLSGYAIYVWHCTRDGDYSLYSRGMEEENFLRGVQRTNDRGEVTFQTIFAGCYPGRYPHVHFEVYRDLDRATTYRNEIFTSQIALPLDIATKIYRGVEGYQRSAENLHTLRWFPDLVFFNNSDAEMKAMTPTAFGDPVSGYQADIVIGLRV